MADGTVSINPGAGVLIDTDTITVGANEVERQRVRLVGSGAAELADVKNESPGMTAYGQVVRLPGPTGQDFGAVVTPEIGKIYVSGKARAAVATLVFAQSVTAGTGAVLLAGIVSTKIYVLHAMVSTDTLTSVYFRTANLAGAVRYITRLAANASIGLTAPTGAFLCDTFEGEGLFIDCSTTATITLSLHYTQV